MFSDHVVVCLKFRPCYVGPKRKMENITTNVALGFWVLASS